VTDQPIEHIERGKPPWREETKTECGRLVSEFAVVLTREQAKKKIAGQGRQRAAMSTCMTCWETAGRHGEWADDPCGVIDREAQSNRWRRGEMSTLETELRALAVLYVAHSDEYDEIVAGLAASVDLSAARIAKNAARRYGQRA